MIKENKHPQVGQITRITAEDHLALTLDRTQSLTSLLEANASARCGMHAHTHAVKSKNWPLWAYTCRAVQWFAHIDRCLHQLVNGSSLTGSLHNLKYEINQLLQLCSLSLKIFLSSFRKNRKAMLNPYTILIMYKTFKLESEHLCVHSLN